MLTSSFQTAPIFRDERTRLRPFATPPISGSLLFPKLDGDGIPPIFPPRRLPHHRSVEREERAFQETPTSGREGVCFPLLLVTPHEVESSVCASLPLSSVAPGLNYFFPPSSSSSIFLANGKVHLGGGASPPLLPPPFSLFSPHRRSGKVCAMAFWRKKSSARAEERGDGKEKLFCTFRGGTREVKRNEGSSGRQSKVVRRFHAGMDRDFSRHLARKGEISRSWLKETIFFFSPLPEMWIFFPLLILHLFLSVPHFPMTHIFLECNP